QNDVTLKMPAFEWVHVQLHQQKGMISLSPPTICNSADETYVKVRGKWTYLYRAVDKRGDTIDFYLSPTRSAKA
ncbi:DDE-type integrase/transposase/recombinase, partial [Enterobacter hormaechei]|uniref:DDE-type integrase/transposase/recombinase n=1 Tax=Enterobacter hormaechei TaxID=158836 RepID=UPI00352439CE